MLFNFGVFLSVIAKQDTHFKVQMKVKIPPSVLFPCPQITAKLVGFLFVLSLRPVSICK